MRLVCGTKKKRWLFFFKRYSNQTHKHILTNCNFLCTIRHKGKENCFAQHMYFNSMNVLSVYIASCGSIWVNIWPTIYTCPIWKKNLFNMVVECIAAARNNFVEYIFMNKSIIRGRVIINWQKMCIVIWGCLYAGYLIL